MNELELKLKLYEFAKHYLNEKEREYVLETGDLPALGIDEVFIFDENGNVIGKVGIVRPMFNIVRPLFKKSQQS